MDADCSSTAAEFDIFVMTLVRSMPINAVAKMIGIYTDRLWRIIDHYVAAAYKSLDFSDVTTLV